MALLLAAGLFAIAWSGHTTRTAEAAERRPQRYTAISKWRLDDLKRLTQGTFRAEAEVDVPPLLMYALLKQQEAIPRHLVELARI